jgi:DNA-binding beta-propeller fold protein YncE
VPDASSHQFFIFAQDGTFLETWGSRGSGEGEFDLNCDTYPHGGVVFDASGAFYVLDAGNARVQKFGRERDFLTSWGNQGDADDQFVCPSGIAVDRQGRVYVSDRSQDKIVVFDGAGAWLATWPTPRTPSGMAVDGDGNIWVANFENSSMVKFSADGDRLATWNETGGWPINGPVHVAIDALDRVFVTEHDRDQVQVFAPDGTLLGAWGEYGEAPGELREPRGIALDGDGGVYVTEWLGGRVQKFRLLPPLAPASAVAVAATPAAPESVAAPVVEFLWEADGKPAAPLILPAGAAVDPRGNLWVTDGFNGWFTIFSPDGAFLETWGSRGGGDGEFELQCWGEGYGGVAFDAAGNIYVADAGNGRIQKFGPDRTFLTSWPSEGIDAEQLLVTGRGSRGTTNRPSFCPVAIAIDGQGRVVVSDRGAGKVEVFAPDGRPLATAKTDQMRPEGVAIDGDDNIWVADSGHRILRFSPNGNLIAAWERFGAGDGELNTPMGLAVDARGRVFVSDHGNRIQVFSGDGAFLGAWGSVGFDAGQFNDPVGLALDGRDSIYVIEHSGGRVQKFRLLAPLVPG